jgi:hypothetical protein
VVTVERAFPFAGHRRGVSRLQLQAIGWHFVAATRSMIRELGTGSGGDRPRVADGSRPHG